MKDLICIFMSIIIAFSTTSCKGSKQEVEKLAVVLATGFDLTPENKYKLTAQVLNPEEDSSKSMSTKKNKQQISSDIMVFTSEGDTPYDAVSHLSTDFGRTLFLGQSQYMVVGKKLAESGLSLFVDAILRGPQARISSTLLLAKDTAFEILSFQPIDQKIPPNSIKDLIKLQSIRGYSPIVSRLDFVNALSSKTAAPIMGVIDINRKDNIGTTFNLAGSGVFKKDKLIGYLNMNETRGLEWVKGNVKDGTITAPFLDDRKIAFLIISSTSQVKPVLENDNIKIKITVKSESNIQDMEGTLDPMKTPKIMDDLATLQSKAIEKEIKLALNAAQKKLNADIFDFGGLIHREYPRTWAKLEDNWEHIFPNIKVEISVISTLKGPGVISKPVK